MLGGPLCLSTVYVSNCIRLGDDRLAVFSKTVFVMTQPGHDKVLDYIPMDEIDDVVLVSLDSDGMVRPEQSWHRADEAGESPRDATPTKTLSPAGQFAPSHPPACRDFKILQYCTHARRPYSDFTTLISPTLGWLFCILAHAMRVAAGSFGSKRKLGKGQVSWRRSDSEDKDAAQGGSGAADSRAQAVQAFNIVTQPSGHNGGRIFTLRVDAAACQDWVDGCVCNW